MATLVSVNIGLPQDVPWKGRTVHTGAWKRPVAGRRMVRRLNIDGDGQGDIAGHGGENRAVLVYQLDSYRHWTEALGRDDLEYGIFGENFTVDGLADDEVCIGDRYKIGELVIEVTQPRVTCYRVGMRIGEPRMAALLVSHHRPGFYCRVIAEGEVEAGQEIVKILSGPEEMTVAEVDALLYLPGHRLDGLQRALRIPALSPGWKASLRSLVEQAEGGSASSGNAGLTAAAGISAPAWAGFRRLRVTAARDESLDVRSLVLADPSGSRMPEWIPGQSITLRFYPHGDGTAVLRNYSLCNSPDSGDYRIGVKREVRGIGSGYLHAEVSEGDLLDVAAPRGSFFLTGGESPVILLSAGVGVTPVLSMLHALVRAHSTREVWWLHGARNGTEHPFAAEVRDLLGRLPRTRSHIYYSGPAAGDRQGANYDAAGRLSAQAIGLLGLPPDADAYLCGPAGFMADITAGLAAAGLDPAHVRSETFGAITALTPGITGTLASPHIPSGPPGSGPQVQFARSGVSAPWGPPSSSLLEFAEACDVPTRWSCRTGVCHNCETALLAGRVRYDPDPLEPPAPGNILICCAEPVEDIVVDL